MLLLLSQNSHLIIPSLTSIFSKFLSNLFFVILILYIYLVFYSFVFISFQILQCSWFVFCIFEMEQLKWVIFDSPWLRDFRILKAPLGR